MNTMGSQSAREAYEHAGREDLYRAELEDRLRDRSSRSGLAFGPINPSEPTGPQLVAYAGELIGEIYTTSPGPFNDWHARRLGGKDAVGPYPTMRAATASFIPHD